MPSDARITLHGPTVVAGAYANLQHEPVDEAALLDRVVTARAGAVAHFVGQVRDHDEGRIVRYLEYSAHPIAGQVLASLVEAAVGDSTGVCKVAAVHRLGRLAVGEVALRVVVSAEHREQAMAAASDLVEAIKHELPVWKHQVFSDGNAEWVGCS